MTDSDGLSLLEVLIGITVAAVAGVLLINLLFSTNNIFRHQNIQVNQGLSLNQAEKKISDVIRLSAGAAGQYPTSGSPQYTTGNNSLVLKLPGVDASGNIIDSVFDYVVISADSSNPKILRLQTFATSPSVRNAENIVLSTSLKEISFQYLDAANSPTSYVQAARVNYVINLGEYSGLSTKESSASGVVNFKNI